MTQVEGDSARPADDKSKQPKRDRTHWLYIMAVSYTHLTLPTILRV